MTTLQIILSAIPLDNSATHRVLGELRNGPSEADFTTYVLIRRALEMSDRKAEAMEVGLDAARASYGVLAAYRGGLGPWLWWISNSLKRAIILHEHDERMRNEALRPDPPTVREANRLYREAHRVDGGA